MKCHIILLCKNDQGPSYNIYLGEKKMYSSQLEEVKQELKVRLKQTALWDEVSWDRQIWVNLTTRADCKVVNTCN